MKNENSSGPKPACFGAKTMDVHKVCGRTKKGRVSWLQKGNSKPTAADE